MAITQISSYLRAWGSSCRWCVLAEKDPLQDICGWQYLDQVRAAESYWELSHPGLGGQEMEGIQLLYCNIYWPSTMGSSPLQPQRNWAIKVLCIFFPGDCLQRKHHYSPPYLWELQPGVSGLSCKIMLPGQPQVMLRDKG